MRSGKTIQRSPLSKVIEDLFWHDWTVGGVAKWWEDVLAVSTAHVASSIVVADSVPAGSVAFEHWGALSAVVGGAANRSSSGPDDLREVAPSGEVGHIWGGLAVLGGWEKVKLAVVPHVGDDTSDEDRWVLGALTGVRSTSHGDVLSVATSTWSPANS